MDLSIAQLIGYLALLFVIFSFQKNKRSVLLAIMLTGLILFVFHYILLGAWTGALMNLIEAGVVFIAYLKETRSWANKSFWPYLFIFLFIVTGIITAESYIDSLPVVAQIFGTLAVWQKNPRSIRFIMLVPRPLWFIYNMRVGSYAGMAAEIFIFISVVIGIIRFDVLGKSSKNKNRN